MMTTTVHTNISSTSVDGITVLRMIMVEAGRPVWLSVDGITVLRMKMVENGRLVWTSVDCCCEASEMGGYMDKEISYTH